MSNWILNSELSTCFEYFAEFLVNIQLIDGPRKGRVEIHNNGRQGLVCSYGWDTHDATVVCQEKNLGTNGIAIQFTYNNTEAVWLNGVNCMGNESGLSLCPHNGIELVDNCTMVAGVECYGKSEIFADIHSSYIAI